MQVRRLGRAMALASLLLTMSRPALAVYPLATDDAGTVDAGAFELELATEYARDNTFSERVTDSSIGAGLRYGISKTMDIGVATGWLRSSAGDTSVTGVVDTELSLKWRVFEQGPLQLALIPALILPTGDENRGLGSGQLSWAATVAGSAELSPNASVHLNLGLDRVNFAGDAPSLTLWRVSAAADMKLADGWLLAIEAGVNEAEQEGATDPAFGTIAAVYTLSDALLLSAGYRAGLNEAEVDHTAMLGITASW